MSSNKKFNKKSGVGILIFALIFIIVAIMLAYLAMAVQGQASKTSLEANETESLKNFVYSVASYTDAKINSVLNKINGYSTSFADAEKMTEEQITIQLNRCVENGDFAALAYVGTDGATYVSKDIGDNPRIYSTEALEGKISFFPD